MHTTQRRIEPRDRGNGVGQIDLVVDDRCSTGPDVAAQMVVGRVQTTLLPGLASQDRCMGWMCCRR